MSEVLFSLSFFGKLVLLCKKGKLGTRIKYEKYSNNLSIFEHKFLLGVERAMRSASDRELCMWCVTPITKWVASKNESNCLLENKMVSTLIWRRVRLL